MQRLSLNKALLIATTFFSANALSAEPAASPSAFGLNLMRTLAAKEPLANITLSPLSLQTALSMTSAGARGETAAEFARVLGASGAEAWHKSLADAIRSIEQSSDNKTVTFRCANRLFLQDGLALVPTFDALMREVYHAPAERWNFVANPEGGRQHINNWVAEQTLKKIPELVPPNIITPDTRLVLTNAIYLKALWQKPFDPSKTQKATFHPDPAVKKGKSIDVPFMHRTGEMPWYQGPDQTVVTLGFAGERLEMMLLVPASGHSVGSILKSLTPESIETLAANSTSEKVILALPRFKAHGAFALKQPLIAMGLRTAFSNQADFSGMIVPKTGTSSDLKVGNVIHEAVLDVTEEGAEGAAATAVVMMRKSAAPSKPPKTLTIDHPFLFILRDTATGTVLFAGQMIQP